MNNKTLAFILFIVLLFSGYVPLAVAHNAPFPPTYDPNSVVVDAIGEPETLDPAWSFDSGSGEIIFNVYETMVFWDNAPANGPYTAGKIDQLKPLLAAEWTWQNGPAPYVKTVYFKVRTGVTFHNGATLTPTDVEYSWERWMVQDRDGGPQWMFYYPVLNIYSATSPTIDPNFGDKINNAIGSNATHAWIHLMNNFPETTLLQIMAQPWASIVEKAWAVSKGDFDGNWGHGWQYIWNTWHNPAQSFIEFDMMGTGPYKFDYWWQGTAHSIVKNDVYWDGWPARVRRAPADTNERIGGFVNRVTWNLLTSWTYSRRPRFLSGLSDYTSVPRQYRDQILGQTVGGELIRSYYPVEPNLAVDAMFFTININPQSPYLGSGFNPNNPTAIAEDRIPINLFSDIHMRRGFAAAFDYDTFLSTAYLGEATQPSDPIIPGLSYDNPANSKPVFNLTKATEELKAAWIGHQDDDTGTPEGAIWDKGMTMILFFNSGNVARETSFTLLANNVNSLNPKFHLSVQEFPWGGPYLPRLVAHMVPMFSIGWLADYPDADNFAFPFMHSQGAFTTWQVYSNPRADALINAGALMPDDTAAYNGELDLPDARTAMNNYNATEIAVDPTSHIPPDTRWPRRSIYYELQALYVEDVPGFCIEQVIMRRWEQAWMRGWYYNPVYPGIYAYHIWKAKTHFGDANNDGVVNVVDAATISASWTKPTPTSPLGPLGYKTQADLTGGIGGTVGGGSGLVAGIPDGKVNVVDAALVSAYWDGPPQGPKHP
jgi:peptide/nickel transport system substrate-binding protein